MRDGIHVLSRAAIINGSQILLCKTVGLDNDFYFLPGGHIEKDESAEVALKREIQEEAGVECTIKRFLGCLEYIFQPSNERVCHSHEYNLIFEVVSPELKPGIPIKKMEKDIQLEWHKLSDINVLDLRPEPLKTSLSIWHDINAEDCYISKVENVI